MLGTIFTSPSLNPNKWNTTPYITFIDSEKAIDPTDRENIYGMYYSNTEYLKKY
jgi:hypothetical protein